MSRKDLSEINEEIKELEAIDYSPLNNERLPAVTYGYIHAFKTMADALKKKPYILFTSGVLAGIWIGIAYIASVYASYSFDNSSIQKLIIGAIFPLVLSLIYFIGGSFLTAYMSMGYPMLNGVGRWKDFFRSMGIVYLGNIVGSFVLVFLLQLSSVYGDPKVAGFVFNNLGLKKMYDTGNQIGENLLKDQVWWSGITAAKVAKSVMFVFFSGIICNMLVSLSSQANKATKGNLIGSIIMFWILIFMFAVSGYQHSVANWYIAWSMLFIGVFQEPFFIKAVVDTNLLEGKVQPKTIIAGVFILINIIPSIFGNYFGAVIMGFLLGIFNHSYSKLLISQYRLQILREDRENLEKRLDQTKTQETSKD